MIKEGIIVVNKPAGMTSHDCIYVVRRLTGIKRVGHTGTLDPNATGVLPVCIGGAARITEYLDMDYKTYECSMVLGLETDTQDIWGSVISDRREELLGDGKLTEERVRAAFEGFHGVISQFPPKYSAVRVNGRRLYEYARDGAEVEIKPRKVFIKELDIVSVDMERLTVSFTVTCSKGTYIRTICHDVGALLGTGAALSALKRTASGVFDIANAVELEYLRELRNKREEAQKQAKQETLADIERLVNGLVLPAETALTAFGEAVIRTEDRAKWFANGGHIRLSEAEITRKPLYADGGFPLEIRDEYTKAYNVFSPAKERFLGVAFYSDKFRKLVADKVFARY